MGFFGMAKSEPRVETPVVVKAEEELPAIPAPSRGAGSTVIAEGITISGTLSGEGVIQVEGIVVGKIELTGAVIVSETGLIRGPIQADVVRVSGRVEGSVIAREHTRLEATGSMEGDVSTASLVVEDGGSLNGRCTMLKPPAPEEDLTDVSAPDDLRFGPGFDLD